MSQNAAGGLERLLEDLVRRAVQDAMAQAGISGGATSSASVASSSVASRLPLVSRAVSCVLQPMEQSEIMAAVLQNASGFAGRCALFVRRGEKIAFWRGEGFAEDTATQLESLSVSADRPGVFQEASENLLSVSGMRTAEAVPDSLASVLNGSPDDALFLFPIVVQGRAVAFLYADSGSDAGSVEASALEILARVTGLSLEIAAGRAAASAAKPPATQDETVPAELPSAGPSAPAGASAPESVEPEPDAPPPPPPAPPAAESTAPRTMAPPPELDSLPAGDRDRHEKAYRSARVAVQDLLAYPQYRERIAEGRRNNTLYRLLKEEIDKNRETYQMRYGQTAACSYDYLHRELVTRLAENNPEMLGPDYPGAVTG